METGAATYSPMTPGSYAERLGELAWYSHMGLAMAIGFSVLAVLLLLRTARAPLLPRRLHGNEKALASLEFLLVFFPLLYIFLAVWQLAFMLNAQMHVGYAAYLAARSASTVIYMESDDEDEGVLLNDGEGGAQKWERIQRAVIPALLPISPGNGGKAAAAALSGGINNAVDNEAAPDFDFPDAMALPGQLSLMAAHRGSAILQGTRPQRAAVKALYASSASRVLINGRGADGGTAPLNLSGAGVISVTVEYDFWLHVPYAGRMMSLAFGGTGGTGGLTESTMTLRETVAINAWPQVSAY